MIVDKKNLLGHGKDAPVFLSHCGRWKTSGPGLQENSSTYPTVILFDRRWRTLVRDDRLMEQIALLNRDPRVFYHEESNGYIMLLYLDKSDYAIFRSEDLLNWRETQRLSLPGHVECPELA